MKGEKKSSVKRFGPRYGSTVKSKVAKLEKLYHGRQKCPYCNYVQVRRIAAGIWGCDKCGAKFAGKAYTLGEKATLAETVKRFEEFEDTEEAEETEEELLDEEEPDKSSEDEPAEETEEVKEVLDD